MTPNDYDRGLRDGYDNAYKDHEPLRKELAQLRLVVGAHIQADAYRDCFPDDEVDGAYLRKQETWWRLTARSWLPEPREDYALLAKNEVVRSPNFKASLDRIFCNRREGWSDREDGLGFFWKNVPGGQINVRKEMIDSQPTDVRKGRFGGWWAAYDVQGKLIDFFEDASAARKAAEESVGEAANDQR